jgi:ABC-type microcin C transport system duplicated ATPase subunit YejF
MTIPRRAVFRGLVALFVAAALAAPASAQELTGTLEKVIVMDHGQIVEDARKDEFFGTPRSERAQQFLSKILHH